MARFGTWDRYVLVEIAPAFVIGFGLFLLAMLTGQLLRLGDVTLALGVGGFGAMAAAQALLFALPPLVGVLLPMAWMFACLLAMSRLSEERELLALAQTGRSPAVLYRVPVMGGVVVALLSMVALLIGEPWGARHLRELFADRARRAFGEQIVPRTFYTWAKDVTVMVDDKQGDTLFGIVLADRRHPERPVVINAANGRITTAGPSDATELVFDLKDGTALLTSDEAHSRLVRFGRGQYRLELGQIMGKQRMSMTAAQEKSVRELWRAKGRKKTSDNQAAQDSVTLQRKFAFPLAAVIFAALATGVGARVQKGARGKSVLFAAVLVASYYAAGRSLELYARAGHMAPILAAWFPNIVGACLAALAARAHLRRCA